MPVMIFFFCGGGFQDNWIAHQDDFNQLLAELNTCHGPETAGGEIFALLFIQL